MRRDPSAMEDMLRVMRRITRYRMGSETPQYLLTHPNPEARLGYVASLLELEKQKTGAAYDTTDNFKFLRFKYRVLMQAIDHEKLRIYCVNTLASATKVEDRTLAHFGLALLAAEERKFDQALQHLATVQEQYPRETILDIDRAVLFIQAGRMDEARTLLEQAVKRDPTDMYGLYQLAKMELMRGSTARAEQLLQRVAAAMPEFPQLYFDLGQIESSRGKEGASVFYLGKYNLYRGKIKLAKQYLTRASKETNVPEQMRIEARALLDKLKDLEKGI